jgi:branched-chain amino acid transport system substrate-binding protein
VCSPMRDPVGSRRVTWLLVCGALALTAAACGGSDDSSTTSSAADTAAAAPAGSSTAAAPTGQPIVIGGPFAQTGPAGIADHKDCWNGAQMAIDEINAAGGVKGRPLKLEVTDIDMLTPEGVQTSFQTLADKKVDAIVSPFVITYQPALDVSAAANIPYLSGGTSSPTVAAAKANPDKYWNFVQDPSEAYYGSGFIQSLDKLVEKGSWTPKNNKVDLVVGDSEYNQLIGKGAKEQIAASAGKWKVGIEEQVTGGQLSDWSAVIQKLKKSDAGVIMIDHWVGAELAGFAQQFSADPVAGSLVYLQYGPSQPEFLDIAGDAAEGFYWGTVIGVPNVGKGADFRKAYAAKYPDTTFGIVYTGWCYDMVQMLKLAWTAVDPSDTKGVVAFLKANPYDGTTGHIDFSNVEAPVYPDNVDAADKGVTHLLFQVQGGKHVIVLPDEYKEGDYVTPPWG